MTAAKVTVVEALAAVMGDVQAVKKGDRNTHQNYNFRGVDAVVNAVGPALRTHGVVVVPVAVSYEDERYQTARGGQMRGVTAIVTFRFYGPAGDFIEAQVAGESSDAGDKAMPKAHSVAFRTLLLEALCVPTDDPDPDSVSHERTRAVPEADHQQAGAGPAAEPPAVTSTPASSASETASFVAPDGKRGVISAAQLKRLHTIASAKGINAHQAKMIVWATASVESSKDIPTGKYDAVIEALEAWKADAA